MTGFFPQRLRHVYVVSWFMGDEAARFGRGHDADRYVNGFPVQPRGPRDVEGDETSARHWRALKPFTACVPGNTTPASNLAHR